MDAGDHELRVMVSRSMTVARAELVSVAIQPLVRESGRAQLSAQEMQLLATWVERNRDVILQHWHGEIDTVDAIAALTGV